MYSLYSQRCMPSTPMTKEKMEAQCNLVASVDADCVSEADEIEMVLDEREKEWTRNQK